MKELPPGHADRDTLRAQVIEYYLPMAVHLARRFAGRGEPIADLAQTAVVGLIKAVDRFDANRGVPFPAYAIPTVLGEIKRYFRDATWTIRIPRYLQELRMRMARSIEDLAQVLQRSPTTAEVAAGLDVSRHDVLLADIFTSAYRPLSVHRPVAGHGDLYLNNLLASTDGDLESVDDRETLRVLLAKLPARDRLVIQMRFYRQMTQAQIARELGVSQVHISRLLTRSLARLRDAMRDEASATSVATPGMPARAGPVAREDCLRSSGRRESVTLG